MMDSKVPGWVIRQVSEKSPDLNKSLTNEQLMQLKHDSEKSVQRKFVTVCS